MRIVLLNQYYAPSDAPTARLLADLGGELTRAGHEVRAICSRRSYPDPTRRHPPRETLDGVHVRRVACTGFGRSHRAGRLLDYATFMISAAVALGRARRPDVIVSLATPPLVAWLGLRAARRRGARAVYWLMDLYPDLAFELGALRRGSWAGRIFRRLSRTTLEGSDRVITLGRTMAERVRDAGAREVATVHNWVDGTAIRPRPVEGHPLRIERGWQERFVVLYSGNLGLAHEFETVLAAATALREEQHIRFVFAGTGPRKEAVVAEARRRGLSNVEFYPWVPQDRLAENLTAADVHLVTLRPGLDGLLVPSKIYGVLAAGRPCLYVGDSDSELARILEEGNCGVTVGVGASDRLAAAVREYAADPGERAAAGRRARELFDERFTLERGVRELRRLIETVG